MKAVFIGGSRRISRLNAEVRSRLDRIVEQKLTVLVGDANGADRAVQQYLNNRRYTDVQVFCMKDRCRNNVGAWPCVEVPAPKGLRGTEFYTMKDQEMTNRAAIGLMLWDGESAGTLANISRLIDQKKPVVVFQSKLNEIRTLRTADELRALVGPMDSEVAKSPDCRTAVPERTLF